MATPLKICFAASEVAPFAKTGGLADVASALPRQLHRMGHDVRVFTPFYTVTERAQQGFHRVSFVQDVGVRLGPHGHRFSLWTAPLPNGGPATYFVDAPELYGRSTLYTEDPDEPRRFSLFCRAVFESCQRMGWAPHVFHCNDWHTALIPLMRRTVYDWDVLFGSSRTLLTIHNIGYQGIFPAGALEAVGLAGWAGLFDQSDLAAGRINLLRTGLLHADLLSTVSPTYAREIQTDGYGMGLAPLLRARRDHLVGILNGVDYDVWSPEKDTQIPHRFSRKRPGGKRKNKSYLLDALGLDGDLRPPLAGVISRFVEQKGFELCIPVLPRVLARSDLRLAVLGSGERIYEEFFARLQRRFAGRVAFYRGYHDELAHVIEAGADLFLMPSRYEPCGLNQMFSLRYGTIPVVRRTGGLADSVRQFDGATGEGTGFVFDEFAPQAFARTLASALECYRDPALWPRLVANAMAEDFSWEHQATRYVEIYRSLASGT